tara:strand:- start:67 stop:765 length:699 start_codon:yes stop_codon:yes gene_type:complete
MTKKVLFLGDSLGLPRPDRSTIDIETWPQIVSEKLHHKKIKFFFQFTGAAHSGTMIRMRNGGYLAGYDPDILILQIGIVDCANRALREGTREFISRIPIIRRIVRRIIGTFHRHILSIRNITYVSRKKFRSNLMELRSLFHGVRFVVIPIAPASDDYCKLMPRIRKNIEDYNEILEDVFPDSFLNEVYLGSRPEDLMSDDFHHLSKFGHKIVSECVAKRISDIVDLTDNTHE